MFFGPKNPVTWFFLVLFCIASRASAEKHIPFGIELGEDQKPIPVKIVIVTMFESTIISIVL